MVARKRSRSVILFEFASSSPGRPHYPYLVRPDVGKTPELFVELMAERGLLQQLFGIGHKKRERTKGTDKIALKYLINSLNFNKLESYK